LIFITAVAIFVAFVVGPPASGQIADDSVLAEAARRSPAVAALLEMPREEPEEQLTAIFTLIDLDEIEVAAALWKPFAQVGLDDAQRAGLAARFGTARLLQLARNPQLAPGAGVREFVDSCLEAAARVARDPRRLAKLIADLDDSSPRVRKAARVDLVATSTDGAVACLEALAQTKAKSARAQLMLVMGEMRPEIDPLLLVVLAEGNGNLRRDVTELAGHTQMFEATPWLAASALGDSDETIVSAARAAFAKLDLPMPTSAEARKLILDEIERLKKGVAPNRRPQAAVDTWWSFDTTAQRLVGEERSIQSRRLLTIARLARLLTSLPGASEADHQIGLLYAIEASNELGDKEPSALQPIDRWATQQICVSLQRAMDDGLIVAAIALVDQLGKRADIGALAARKGRPSTLATALTHADRELRFAALQAVMKISPTQTFAGASNVPKCLWQFVGGAGQVQAIAASSVAERANDWAGRLRGLGYDATSTGSGRQATRTALNSPRLALILVDSDIGRPLLREVVYQLRANEQISHTPVAVLSSLANLDRAQRIATNDKHLIAVARPHGDAAFQKIVDDLVQISSADFSPQRRTEQAAQALEWIATLLENGHPYDELLRGASGVEETLYLPSLTELSLRVLSLLETAGSQQTLVEIASNESLPIEMRRLAAASLTQSVERVGKLLTASEIATQYDRYNASETADRETQKVLGSVLDVLEGN